MGIPKFFRWISERYPLTSQLILENNIPEFDNLYVDFNGIIHNCSHPNDGDVHFRLTEEQIFTSIFAYVDHLFTKIKPKKVFFMAIDGVAPRAKMNQQRSRRFRTAKETKEAVDRALKKGEKLPEEKAFDSNCITPGTPFMARLSLQLQYFVNKKISEDSNWRDVQVILSGHEVPGEGEHKIMEYIRLSKAQQGYEPNTRHCLYGLDADLIMLGLLSHDPHFCLLREEVKFGPQSKKKSGPLEMQQFYLLHLCLFREYLHLEFQPLWDPSANTHTNLNSVHPNANDALNGDQQHVALPFDYSLERIIDDFILLAVFVGNDFLPHLPDLHIHDNAFEVLFEKYRQTLPKAGGYINEHGKINLQRLQVFLDALSDFEMQAFEKEHSDLNWFKGKQRPKELEKLEEKGIKGAFTLTRDQQLMFKDIEKFILQARQNKDNRSGEDVEGETKLSFVNSFPARDRAFLSKIAGDLNLVLTWDEYNDKDENLAVLRLPNVSSNGNANEGNDDESSEDDGGEAGRAAVDRVLNKYKRANILEDEGTAEERYDATLKKRMEDWKRQYYREKLDIKFDDHPSVDKLVYRYIEGLQWVMYYYYQGVASWGWFYDYHYAPRISDLKNVDKMVFDFALGTPFRPFEQLMGVLPAASMEHIPMAYRELMTDPTSPILDFYPQDFDSDLNGKKADWEAIVKIPFIQEDRLLRAMASKENQLTAEEKKRNGFGSSITFTYSPDKEFVYPSSLPGFFPDIHRCHCTTEPFNLPTLTGLRLIHGLLDGVGLGVHAMAGFPSLDTLPHTAQLLHHSVNVFQQDSRNQSIVLFIKNQWTDRKGQAIAEQLVGQKIFYNWPFLQEGMVVAVSDSHFKYEVQAFGKNMKVAGSQHGFNELSWWNRKAEGHESRYSKRFGVITGDVDYLVHVRPLKSLKRLEDGALVKDWEDADKETDLPLQLLVKEVNFEDERFKEQAAPPLEDEFPIGSTIFFLGEHAYGVVAQVQDHAEGTLSVTLAFFPGEKAESDQLTAVATSTPSLDYYPSYNVAQMVGITGLAVSRITSSFMVIGNDGSKTNLGLSIKFQGKGMKVLGYTRSEDRSWEYSAKAVELLRDYKVAFPQLFQKLGDNRGDAMTKSADLFPGPDADAKVKAARAWLTERGTKDLEPVPLATETLEKETIAQIEALATSLAAKRSADAIKKAKVQRIPRRAVLKPAHVTSRLQGQQFKLGDRVVMVQDSGNVPLCAKGVVVGLVDKMIDVVWDNAFIGGSTLSGRCSEYRGSTCTPNSCLNLTNKQFIISTVERPAEQTIPVHLANAYASQRGTPSNTPPPNSNGRGRGNQVTMRIMSNPNRGRGGRGGSPAQQYANTRDRNTPSPAPQPQSQQQPQQQGTEGPGSTVVNLFQVRGRGGFRGRGPVITRGRGGLQHPIPALQQQWAATDNQNGNGSPRGRGSPAGGNNRGRGASNRGDNRGGHRSQKSSDATGPS